MPTTSQSSTMPYYSRWIDLPSPEQLCDGITTATGLEPTLFDVPANRLEFVRQRQPARIVPQLLQLHATVIPDDEFEAGSRLATVASWRETLPRDDPKNNDVLFDRMGVPAGLFSTIVAPHLIRMQRMIADVCEASETDRLDAIAQLEGFTIVSAQLLFDANTRVARTQSGLIAGGVAEAYQRLTDPESYKFALNECVEVGILLHNTCTAMSGRDIRLDDPLIALSKIDEAGQRMADYLWPQAADGQRPGRNQLRKAGDRFTPEHLTARMGILQRTYGAAALAACGVETPIDLMADGEIAAFEQSLRQLMVYRIISGIAIITADFLEDAGIANAQ